MQNSVCSEWTVRSEGGLVVHLFGGQHTCSSLYPWPINIEIKGRKGSTHVRQVMSYDVDAIISR